MMTIDSLVHSNPVTPTNGNSSSTTTTSGETFSMRRRMPKRPSIDVYFLQNEVQQRRNSGSWGHGNKRI